MSVYQSCFTLREFSAKFSSRPHTHKLKVGSTVLDWDSLTVDENSRITVLPQKEFGLLFKLLSYKERIFTRRQLMDEIWEMDSETDERTVDVHIRTLRSKLGEAGDLIETVRGVGYKFTGEIKQK